jgi:exosortase E/protease (VPEID-CTERM system)
LSAGARRWRLAAAALLAACEAGWLLTQLETGGLSDLSGGAARLLSGASILPRIALVALFASVLLASETTRAALRNTLAQAQPPRRALAWLAVQLSCFAALSALGRALFAQAGAWRGSAAGLALALLLACCCSAALLCALAPARAWRHFAAQSGGALAAALLLGIGGWAVGELASARFWDPLRSSTLALCGALLEAVDELALYDREAFVFGTRDFAVHVEPACSGFEGIGLSVVLIGAYLAVFRERLRFPRAFALLLVGALASFVANALRLVALVLIGAHLSPELAREGFHSVAGTLALCVVCTAVVALGRTRWLRADEAMPPALDRSNATAAHLAPLLAVIATGLVTGALARDIDRLHAARLASGGLALWWLRAQLAEHRARPGAAVALAAGLAAAGIWSLAMLLAPAPERAAQLQAAWLELGPGARAAWLATRALSFVALAPVVEELAFRGHLMRRLSAADFRSISARGASAAAVLSSALAFGLLHERWAAASACGLCYALAYRARERLADAVLAHACTNALLFACGFASGDWSWWS